MFTKDFPSDLWTVGSTILSLSLQYISLCLSKGFQREQRSTSKP